MKKLLLLTSTALFLIFLTSNVKAEHGDGSGLLTCDEASTFDIFAGGYVYEVELTLECNNAIRSGLSYTYVVSEESSFFIEINASFFGSSSVLIDSHQHNTKHLIISLHDAPEDWAFKRESTIQVAEDILYYEFKVNGVRK